MKTQSTIENFKLHEKALKSIANRIVEEDLYDFVSNNYYLVGEENENLGIENINQKDLWFCGEIIREFNKQLLSVGILIGRQGIILKEYFGGGDEYEMLEELYPEQISLVDREDALKFASESKLEEEDIYYL